ncbi:DUF1538 domain-containing protein [Irregularibacter muris]|uniref:DUF1538 domain-containing protein n=1 Tax=Irregularibacter muris TaxID=1796619 RepID=A0AAE3HCA2_9FIRM|nr:DUF1538 domain-containing protein [Irregularibacter muris]MCR1897552.1 DUF1538 domain-containing protein [Irregularibacter muris]
MNVLMEKFKEVLLAVLPIMLIVLILHFTIAPMESNMVYRFLLGGLFIILGLSIFLLGADLGITPIGTHLGSSIVKSNKAWIVGVAGLILGFFISIAEPDLHILAGQVNTATAGLISKLTIVVVVSIGIALMLSTGLLRIIFNKPLNKLLSGIYFIIFILAIFASPEFLAISFDASGATTGAMATPFMLALGLGVSSLKAGKASEEDSFGLVGIASSGAILSVLAMSILSKSDKISDNLEQASLHSTSIIRHFIEQIPGVAWEVFLALLPLLLIFLFVHHLSIKLPKRNLYKIMKGLIYTFIGLVLFLVGVNAGFMEVGSIVGHSLASYDNKLIVVLVGFIIGLVVILAEPAVYVLTNQIESVTSGYIKRKVILFALSIGVGVSVALSIIRILIPQIQLWHYLLPGYIASLIMSYFVPSLFVGIAFDSGGVASGPMTATFILAFAQGVAQATEGANVLIDGFGIIAMVALTPLIALQVLGLIFKMKTVKGDL